MESLEGSPEAGNGVIPQPSLDPKARFSTGFLFGESGDELVLVHKKRPAWQAGRLNGIGGKIEPGETPLEAMARECIEEAGVNPEWSQFACVEYTGHVLHFFAARDEAAYLDARPQTDEDLIRMHIWNTYHYKVIPNLQWLVPMAHHHLFYEKVVLGHLIMSGSGGAIARLT